MSNYLTVVTPNQLVTTTEQDDLIKKVKELLRQKDAFSPNTFEQLKYIYNAWAAWCQVNQRQPLPIHAEDIKEYIRSLADRGVASTSIKTHKTYLNMLHRHLGLPPITLDLSVGREVRATSRRAAMDGERTGQAIPLRKRDLILLRHTWKDSPRLVERRNLAAVFMSYNTMLRQSELARIKVSDLQYQDDGTILVDIGYTKTIVGGAGLKKVLGRQCAALVKEWLRLAKLEEEHDAYVLSPVTRFDRIRKMTKPLTRPNMNKIFSDAWHALGKVPMPPNKQRYTTWTGHSCRVGAAQDLMLQGESLAAIMHEGTWKDPRQAMSYLREIEAHCSKLTAVMNDESW
jgi:integrase